MLPKSLCLDPGVKAEFISADLGEDDDLKQASVRLAYCSFISLCKEIEPMKSKSANLLCSSGITNSNLTPSFHFFYNFLYFPLEEIRAVI